VIEVDYGKNCYSFGHLACYYHSQIKIGKKKRIKYKDNTNNVNNLKEKESLIVLD